MTPGARMIASERTRQRQLWGDEHDDRHGYSQLAEAAIVYVRCALTATNPNSPLAAAPMAEPPTDWPWEPEAFKPKWGDPIRTLVKAGALIAAEIDRLQRQGQARDTRPVHRPEDGRLTVDRASDPCYICGASVAPSEGWHRQEADGVHRHWCPEHQPVWSRAGLSAPPLKVARARPVRVLDPDAALGLPPGTYEASSRRRQRMEPTATVTVLSVWGKLDVGVDSSPVPASHVVWLVAAADTGWPPGLTVLRKASGERLRSDDPVYAGDTVVVGEEVATDA